MGKNRFREDALKYWDIRCEDVWGRFKEAVRENPYLTAKEFCIKDMGCVAPFMKWTRRTKHSITALRRQALEERMKAKGLERRDSAEDPTPGNMFIQFVPKKATGLYPYKGISLTFLDGVNLSLQECTAEGLSSLLDIYNKRKEESVCFTALAACRCDTSIDLNKCDLTSAADLREMFGNSPVQGCLDTLKNLLDGEYCDWHFEIIGFQPIMYLPDVCGDNLSIYRRTSLPCGFGFSGPALSWLRFHTGIARGGEELALRFVGILLNEEDHIVNDVLLLAPATCNLCTREQADVLTQSMKQAAAASLGETKYGVAGLRGSSFVPYEDGRYSKADGSRSMQTSFAGFFPADKPVFRDIPSQVVNAFVGSNIVAERICPVNE